jgi:hypothetical protein
MAKVKAKLTAKKGKSGTKLASYTVRVAKSKRPQGDLLFQPKVNMSINVKHDSQGKPRKDT